jgi:hypothetical protein
MPPPAWLAKLLRLIMPIAYSSPIDFRKVRSIGASYEFHLPTHHWGLRSVVSECCRNTVSCLPTAGRSSSAGAPSTC